MGLEAKLIVNIGKISLVHGDKGGVPEFILLLHRLRPSDDEAETILGVGSAMPGEGRSRQR